MTAIIDALTVIFVAAAIMLFVIDRLGHPPIPAYILAGIAVGMVVDPSTVMDLAQIGIMFLVFMIGVKTSPDRLRSVADDAMTAALLQITLVAVAVYIGATATGITVQNALYLSLAAALSSSLVGLEFIEDELRVGLLHGRIAESINLVQDAAGVLFVAAVLTVPFVIDAVAVNLVAGAAFIMAALLIRRYLAPVIAAQADGSQELMMLTGMTLLTGFLALSQFVGLSVVVGAFAAGFSLAKFPFNLEMLGSMESLKDFFSAVFFVVLGAMLTVPAPGTLIIAAVLTVVTVVVKPALTAVILMVQGYDSRTAYMASMGVDHVSEFALIVAIQAFIFDAIATPVFEGIVLAATATMIISSYTTRYADTIYTVLVERGLLITNHHKLQERSTVADDLSGHIILAGYGVQGKLISEELRRRDKEFVVVDNDPEQISEASQIEEHYVLGNVMTDHPWRMADAADAALIISTIPERGASEEILSLSTDADIILRARDAATAEALLEQGAIYVDVPDITAAEQLADHVAGVLDSTEYRDRLRKRNREELESFLYSSEP